MIRLALVLSSLAALLTGCATDGLVCDEMAVAAVFITVVDIDGAAIDSATATWETADESGDCFRNFQGYIASKAIRNNHIGTATKHLFGFYVADEV